MASSSVPISQAGGTGYSPFPDSRVSKADIVLFPLRKQPVPGPEEFPHTARPPKPEWLLSKFQGSQKFEGRSDKLKYRFSLLSA